MGKPHRPRPVLINFPNHPIQSIHRAAVKYVEHCSPEDSEIIGYSKEDAETLLAWIEDQMDQLEEKISKLDPLHLSVYDMVVSMSDRGPVSVSELLRVLRPSPETVSEVIRRGKLAWGDDLEDGDEERLEWTPKPPSPSGVRGCLSRLVDRGLLCRVARNQYWPASIAFSTHKPDHRWDQICESCGCHECQCH